MRHTVHDDEEFTDMDYTDDMAPLAEVDAAPEINNLISCPSDW